MRKIKGNSTVSRCIDVTPILRDTSKKFDRKYKEVLDESKCQAHSLATDPMLRWTNFSSALKDLDVAVDRLNPCTGFNSGHTFHNKNSKRCYRILS